MTETEIQARIIFRLHRLLQKFEAALDKRLNTLGITARQFLLLGAIKENPGAAQSHLVSVTGMDRSTLADIMRRLQRKNLINRSRSKHDARANEVQITPNGEHVLLESETLASELEQMFIQQLNNDARHIFLQEIERLAGIEPLLD